jgi:SAM-dependent methyltransferase
MELAEAVARYRDVFVDVGCGDGKWALRFARAHPEAFVVGIDLSANAVASASARAGRKPARGGAENCAFVVGDALRPPGALRGVAAEVLVAYPWGSLLRAVGEPQVEALSSLTALLRPGGRFVAYLNLSAAADPGYAERLSLPGLDPDALVAGWEAAGLERVECSRLAPGEAPAHRTSWGQRLVRGAGRETLVVSAVRPAAASAAS